MQPIYTRKEKAAGLFVLVVLALMAAAVVVIGRGKHWFESYLNYTTTFKESYNLKPGAAVKLFRTDIGRVRRLTLEGDKVRVELAILERYAARIRKDSVCIVESPTLIGKEYVALIPGSPDQPVIPENGEIPSREKRSLEDILDEFQVERTAKRAVAAIQALADLADVLRDPRGPLLTGLAHLERGTAHLEQILADVDAGKGPIGALVNSPRLLAAIQEAAARIDRILADVEAATHRAPQAMEHVNQALGAFGRAGVSLEGELKTLRTIVADAAAAVASLKAAMENLEQGSRKVPAITVTAADGIEEIRLGVERIDRVVQSLERNVLIRGNLPPVVLPEGTRPPPAP